MASINKTIWAQYLILQTELVVVASLTVLQWRRILSLQPGAALLAAILAAIKI